MIPQPIDARTLTDGKRLSADLCIIGAGAAGLSVAAGFGGVRSTLIVESGGPPATAESLDERNVGRARGRAFGPRGRRNDFLHESRRRTVGGTATLWRRSCRPLPDFERSARPWIDADGWPVDPGTLAPFERRALDLLGVGEPPGATEAPTWDGAFDVRWEARPGDTAFPDLFDRHLEAARLQLLTHATAVEVRVDPVDGAARAIRVRTARGEAFTVEASTFVLAAGALENARLLLASRRVESRGVGNEHDLVGRYFMDQIGCRVGMLTLPGHRRRMQAFSPTTTDGVEHLAFWQPSPRLQRRHELLATSIYLAPVADDDIPALTGAVQRLSGTTRTLAPDSGEGRQRRDRFQGAVTLIVEPRPDRDSRVRLGEAVDALGVPRLDVTWRAHEYESWTLRSTSHLLAETVGAALAGRMFMPRIRQLPRRAHPLGHHGGTTRMSRDPRAGVVDPDGRVHGVPNLYIAGSSVFPTIGSAPPLVTAMALALRLGGHLRSRP